MKSDDLNKLAAKLPLSKSTLARNALVSLAEKIIPDSPIKSLPMPTKRIRQSSKPLLNKLEMEWLSHVSCSFAGYEFKPQAIKLRTSRSSFYKPDFIGWHPHTGRIVIIEVKGPRQCKNVDRGVLSLKTAASAFPWFQFHLTWKEHGLWKVQEVLP